MTYSLRPAAGQMHWLQQDGMDVCLINDTNSLGMAEKILEALNGKPKVHKDIIKKSIEQIVRCLCDNAPETPEVRERLLTRLRII